MGERLNTTTREKPTPLEIRDENGEIRIAPPESDDPNRQPLGLVIRGLGARPENDEAWPGIEFCPSETAVRCAYPEAFSQLERKRAHNNMNQYVGHAQKEGWAIKNLAKEFGKKPDIKINFDNPLNGKTMYRVDGHIAGVVGQHLECAGNYEQYLNPPDAEVNRIYWGLELPPEQAQKSPEDMTQLTTTLAGIYPDLAKKGKLEKALQAIGPKVRVGLAEALRQAQLGKEESANQFTRSPHLYLVVTPAETAVWRASGKKTQGHEYGGPYLVGLRRYLELATQRRHPGGVNLPTVVAESQPLLALQAAMVARQFRMDFEAQHTANAGVRRAQRLGQRAVRG